MTTLYDFTLTDIDGASLPLSEMKGKTVLLVNVASECGLTPQYRGLQELYSQYRNDGLVVLACPCNQFGGQEPGTESEIKSFCIAKFNVTFPMSSKIEVNGEDRHPLYQWLIGEGEDIQWNFEKFLVNSEGSVVGRYNPRVQPDDPELVGDIREALNP
ncbi:glutathione peroxidase [Hahella sp. CCB-MM4]|uniref:glutathione peroxidase n=1 Tax=Hahella sp. (strain CCB-MM4) TaxID=1926491 RepID=UPI000B9C64A0|nr:glutathione peroxidase [Hahella sp. CCB-MM4]OZG75271.1 glutathione peroxidase [Hahella sp. CCB-MM4]